MVSWITLPKIQRLSAGVISPFSRIYQICTDIAPLFDDVSAVLRDTAVDSSHHLIAEAAESPDSVCEPTCPPHTICATAPPAHRLGHRASRVTQKPTTIPSPSTPSTM